MEGYKGFKKGLVCRGKQYAENTIFEEENAKICESGMHFCKNPLEVLRFYPPCDKNGELNAFAKVEALNEVKTDDNKKFCTSKLKINKQLSFIDFINEGVAITCKDANNDIKTCIDNYSTAINAGDYSTATSSHDYSTAINRGDYSVTTNTGWNAISIAEGNYSSIAASTGERAVATSKSERSIAANTGSYAVATSTDNYSITANTGLKSVTISMGCRSIAANTSSHSAAISSGNRSIAVNVGNNSTATAKGRDSIAIVTGANSRARGVKGSWIVCAEYDEGYNLCVKAVQVDGEKIQENTFYALKNGEFVKAE